MSDRHHQNHVGDPTLEALSALYREAPALEPPPALDAQVLAMAREETRVRRLPARSLKQWSMPLSLAAVLVLAVVLVPLLQQELPRDQPPAVVSETVPGTATQAPKAAADGASSEVVSEEERSQEIMADVAGEAATVASPAPAPPSPNDEPPAFRQRESLTPAPASSSPDRESLPLAIPRQAPAPREEDFAPTPSLSESPGDTGQRATSPEEGPARSALIGDPERWLTWIRLLYRQERTAEAEEELAAFRQQFPDYPLDSLEGAVEP